MSLAQKLVARVGGELRLQEQTVGVGAAAAVPAVVGV